MYDVIIIGGGPAGLTAAIYTRRAGYTTLVLEGGLPGGQAATTPDIENWPGSQSVAGSDFSMNLYVQATALGAELRFESVTSLADLGNVKVVTTARGALETKTVIIANGVRRRKLGVTGEERLAGRGVSYCATCDGGFFKGQVTAVVGGGNTALEDALFLSNICPQVYLIHRRAAFTAEKYLTDALAAKSNIHLLLEHKVLEITGEDKVTAIEVEGPQGRSTLSVAGVFSAIGLIPDNAIFSPPLALDEYGYIKAGEDTHTNVPGVFAAGDTRVKALRQLVTAAADGAAAAHGAGLYLQGLAHQS